MYKTDITKIGDPFIIKHNNKYYLYATSDKEGFIVWESDDLINFENKGHCYKMNENSFGYECFWAPEVVFHNNRFIMHYTAKSADLNSLRIGVAVSASPLGPFKDVYRNKPMFDLGYACIDASVFVDDDKKCYIYYSKDCSENVIDGVHTSQIYACPLRDDLLALDGEPTLLLTPTLEYERKSLVFDNEPFVWNEGPYMVKQHNIYYLFYSCNFYADPDYSVCLATSKYPNRDFEKLNEPILCSKHINLSGPGHNMVFKDGKNFLLVYHVHTSQSNPSGDRTVCISNIKFKDSNVTIE
ncbi:MAG: glycoside hydrolase family 43 protein [Acholeplasmatales bacterium]|jgi:GH43 family beta-xylosidase|nr:glycoside hydrolase family 43 protein [Acholeplasmatales bacterium]